MADPLVNNVVIRDDKVFRNSDLIFKAEKRPELPLFLKQLYKVCDLDYPKFFKMDELSKLAILGVELLCNSRPLKANTPLIFANSASSLETDEIFQKSMNCFASPSVFVYTLPNIMLGEISIRHQLKSENIFFISESFDVSLYLDYLKNLFKDPEIETALCGWVNLHSTEYDVFLCEINRKVFPKLNEEVLKKIYLSKHE